LTNGERVVTEGLDRLLPGAKVMTKTVVPINDNPGRRGRGGAGGPGSGERRGRKDS
jgi:hypothetical protein